MSELSSVSQTRAEHRRTVEAETLRENTDRKQLADELGHDIQQRMEQERLAKLPAEAIERENLEKLKQTFAHPTTWPDPLNSNIETSITTNFTTTTIF